MKMAITLSLCTNSYELSATGIRPTTILVDHPLRTCSTFGQLEQLATARYIVQRLERAELFRLYLDAVAEKLELTQNGFNWKLASAQLAADIRQIRYINVPAARPKVT